MKAAPPSSSVLVLILVLVLARCWCLVLVLGAWPLGDSWLLARACACVHVHVHVRVAIAGVVCGFRFRFPVSVSVSASASSLLSLSANNKTEPPHQASDVQVETRTSVALVLAARLPTPIHCEFPVSRLQAQHPLPPRPRHHFHSSVRCCGVGLLGSLCLHWSGTWLSPAPSPTSNLQPPTSPSLLLTRACATRA